MSQKSRTWLLVFSLLGLAASITSSYVHYQLLVTPNYESFCDVGATMSCTEAYLSRYGSFMGVPVAIGGVIFFSIAALLAGITGKPGSAARENAPAYIFVLSTFGLAFALYLAWASYFQLKVFCILCAITYVSVIALFIISGGATTFPMTTLPRRASRDLRTLVSTPVAIAALLAVVIGSAVLITVFPNEVTAAQARTAAVASWQPVTPQQRDELKKWWEVQPTVDVPVPPSAGTKVLIVKFSDYMCPACRAAHDAIKPVLPKYQGKGVEFVMKHYPLEPECNPNVPTGNHVASCEAAAAYEMARTTPNQAKLDDWFFANQGQLTREVVKQAAEEQAGIKDFDAKYPAAIQAVRTDATLGGLLNVNSTPTIFINGRRIPGAGLPPQYLDALIEIILAEGK